MQIIAFQERYKDQVIHLISSIQQQEFGVKITPEEQPDLCDIETFFRKGVFLIALDHDKVVGTIGLVNIDHGNGVLRKMFVHADYRGKGVAQQLLEHLFSWATEHAYKTIYLGTLSFYTQHIGFMKKVVL